MVDSRSLTFELIGTASGVLQDFDWVERCRSARRDEDGTKYNRKKQRACDHHCNRNGNHCPKEQTPRNAAKHM